MVAPANATEPAVIDEELCRKCIGALRTHGAAQDTAVTEGKKEGGFREVKCLLLSYKNILKIDNLVGFERLVKLQLDNNIIEKIENLGHLTALEWLDLSFNNIAVMSGLESLVNLTNLSLFSNRITQLGGLDTLTKLQVLSVGNNLITAQDSVMYLRPFKELQAVNFVGNPFCQETEYRPYVLAHLKYLKYLDYRLVDEQAVISAREQYQDELLDMEENEAALEAASSTSAERAERMATLKAANLHEVHILRDEMLTKGEGEVTKLRAHPVMAEPVAAFREAMTEAADEYIANVLELHKQKTGERELFTSALEEAKAQGAVEAKEEIAKYGALKKKTMIECGQQLQTQQLQMLQKANTALYETLMDLEMAQVERYAASISSFDLSYDELSKKTQEATTGFFGRLRDLEAAYHERAIAAATEMMENKDDKLEGLSEEAKTLLQDKETLMNTLNGAHDAKVSRLDQREDELRNLDQQALTAVTQQARNDEYTRNRTRVVEIWNLVHVIHKNELELSSSSMEN